MDNNKKNLFAWRELLATLAQRNLKVRYKSSALGFFWCLLSPLSKILIFAMFAGILKFNLGMPDYLPFLVIGIIIWDFVALCMSDALGSIVGNANLVKKTSFPRIILPLANVWANLINFLLTFGVLFIFLLVWYIPKGTLSMQHLWLLPVIIVSQAAFCLGITTLLAAMNVFFRDTEHISGVFQLAWYFLTPIFYTVDKQTSILANYGNIYPYLVFLNPMTGIACAYRYVLMGNNYKTMFESVDLMPSLGMISISFGVCWLFMLVGISVFIKCQKLFADEL
ncbi:MAG: ABC transporter permease [Kiritimatiellae bacterium]|jgi:lipopolysaccharide transport system permease protein|nr:ABC transporter permease [Kiritimatiellia bacterium]